MTDSSQGSWQTRGGRWLLAAAVAGAALAVGSVHTGTLCVVALALAVACALTWWTTEEVQFRPRPAATLLLATGLGLTAYTALQCVPMPIAWLAHLAPHNAEVWSRALMPLRETGPTWAPVSLDPTATRIEVLKGLSYLLAFVTALRIAERRAGVAFLNRTIMATAAVLVVASLLHPAFGAHKLYGVFEPSLAVREKHLAPFLNPNNFAAYLNVAFCLALAAALSPEPPVPRPIVGALAVTLGATQVWVASRAGVATMLLGAVLVVAMGRMAHLRRRMPADISVVAALAIASGIFMIVLGSSEDVSSELFETNTAKLTLLREALRMVPAYPLFGVGRGAFESTFPEINEAVSHYMSFTHPENVIAQWVTEWGVPVGLGGLVAVGVGLRPSAMLARSSTATGAWCAIVCVVLQNLVDLGSEIPGLMLTVVVCGAIVVGGTAGLEPRTAAGKWARAPRSIVLGAGVLTCSAVLAAAVGIPSELGVERVRAYEATGRERFSDEAADDFTRAAMLRHPEEPYLPFARGLRAAREGDSAAVRWIGATLERAHVYGPAHLVLARVLASRSRSQARLEYRLALQQAPETAGIVMGEASRLIESYDDARELVPDVEHGIQLDDLTTRLEARLPATSVRLDAMRAIRSQVDDGPVLRAAKNAVVDLEAGDDTPWCDGNGRSQCQKVAFDRTSQAEALSPQACEPRNLHARARFAGGDPIGALRELTEAADSIVERVPCLKALWGLARQAHDEGRATDAVDKIASSGCSEDGECANNLAWAAEAERGSGNVHRALALYERASARHPEDDTLIESSARLAAAVGMHGEAAEQYRRLARKHPENPSWSAAADQERSVAMRAAEAP